MGSAGVHVRAKCVDEMAVGGKAALQLWYVGVGVKSADGA